MELLITPAQVAEMAFRAPDFITADAVSEATIVAAQQKYLKPVLGAALYERLLAGEYSSLVADYLAEPLALYVKMSMLTLLAVQAGTGGVVEVHSANLARAGEEKLRVAVRTLRRDAGALMRRAVRHIEEAPEAYPEYDPRDNILNRCSIEGGVVLDKNNRSDGNSR